MKESTDKELILQYRQGDEEALQVLIRRYLRPMYYFARTFVKSEEADDMVQEIFIKVWKHSQRFDIEKSFKVWLYRIARNTCLDYLRKKQPVLFSELSKDEDGETTFIDAVADDRPSAFEKMAESDAERAVDEALAKLPAPSREVFELYYRGQMTFQEIADALHTSINTVKSRHRRGLETLRGLAEPPKPAPK